MEKLCAEETEINHKIQEIERKRVEKGMVNLREIKNPQEITLIADEERNRALERNSKFLQELSIESGKLHTKRMLPIHSKLEEIRNQVFSPKS